jgi:hypothetical protein
MRLDANPIGVSQDLGISLGLGRNGQMARDISPLPRSLNISVLVHSDMQILEMNTRSATKPCQPLITKH